MEPQLHGMVLTMGIDIAKILAREFGKNGKPLKVQPATLTKSTPGTRTPGAISAGTNPTTQTFRVGQAMVAEYSQYYIAQSLVKQGDRKVTLFGASIQGGAVPEPGDRITIGGETLTIYADGVTGDGVKATWSCRCRK